MRKLAAAAAAGLLLLLAILVIRATTLESRQVRVAAAPRSITDPAPLAERLAASIRIRTVSHQDSAAVDAEQFASLSRYLERTFPRVHASLQRETVGGHSLLFTWPGSAPAAAKPVLLMGHFDTVPVEPESEGAWTHPPFSGTIADGFVWGRGTLDDKAGVLGVLESAELLLGEGFRPKRTVYFAFGHDEEIGGKAGAEAVAALLAERGVELDLVLDEGGAIVSGFLPGSDAPVATIGIAEKGYVSVELSVETAGGHSSIPPAETAIGLLSTAISRLEANPLPASLDSVVRHSLDYIGPEAPFLFRLALANLWLFGPLVERQFSRVPATNAFLRTTTAPTILRAGLKDNVLPASATGVVNFRILPGETVETVLDHVRRTMDDPKVRIRALPFPSNPSPLSPAEGPAFTLLQRTIGEVFPGAVVTPSLVLGATDSRHFTRVSKHVYRFLPIRIGPDDLQRIHGTNERIGVEDYATVVEFYVRLLRNAAG